MPDAQIDGIKTRYEVNGEGPPLLMLAPGGFDAYLSRWRLNGVWKDLQPLDALAGNLRVIAYDRRESGESGGRVEPLTWVTYARHAVAVLDHLDIKNAFLLGGCMGCSVATAIAAHFPQRCRGLLLHWPVGGYRWMNKGLTNFDRHIAFARANGLAGVVERARKSKLFWGDPEAGPWSSVVGSDAAFAEQYARQDLNRYLEIVTQSRDTMFDDTMPSGASGEQLAAMNVPAFIMPGDDPSHATSCAHALRELIPQSQLSPLMPPQQNAATVRDWIYQSAGIATTAAAA